MALPAQVMHIHHVTLEIPSEREEQARQFYTNLMGFQEMEIPGPLQRHEHGGIWFAVGSQQLHLGPVPRETFHPQRRGHVAFQVRDLASMKHALAEAGGMLQIADWEPGWSRCYVLDPFGNRLELRQWQEEEDA